MYISIDNIENLMILIRGSHQRCSVRLWATASHSCNICRTNNEIAINVSTFPIHMNLKNCLNQ